VRGRNASELKRQFLFELVSATAERRPSNKPVTEQVYQSLTAFPLVLLSFNTRLSHVLRKS